MTAAWGQDAPIEDGGDDRDDAVEDDAYLPLGDADDSFPAQAEHSDAIAADSLDRELSALELRMQELQRLDCCYHTVGLDIGLHVLLT